MPQYPLRSLKHKKPEFSSFELFLYNGIYLLTKLELILLLMCRPLEKNMMFYVVIELLINNKLGSIV